MVHGPSTTLIYLLQPQVTSLQQLFIHYEKQAQGEDFLLKRSYFSLKQILTSLEIYFI